MVIDIWSLLFYFALIVATMSHFCIQTSIAIIGPYLTFKTAREFFSDLGHLHWDCFKSVDIFTFKIWHFDEGSTVGISFAFGSEILSLFHGISDSQREYAGQLASSSKIYEMMVNDPVFSIQPAL